MNKAGLLSDGPTPLRDLAALGRFDLQAAPAPLESNRREQDTYAARSPRRFIFGQIFERNLNDRSQAVIA
jgi:hypothetical protein